MPKIMPLLNIFATLLLMASLCNAASAGEPGQPPAGSYKGYNLLIVSVTNIGAEQMSLYGYSRKTTPNLDRWASGALVFEDAVTQASWTLPAATSMFTSLYPYTHQVMGRSRNMLLSMNLKTLPEILRAFGYKTAAFTGGLDYMGSLGHMRGFQTAPDNPPFTRFDVTLPQASKWLLDNKGGRFFLFVNGYDAHPPFLPAAGGGGVFVSTAGKHITVDPAFTYRGYRETSGEEITAYYHEPRGVHDGSAKAARVSKKKVILKRDDVDYLRDLYDDKVLEADAKVGSFLDSLDSGLLEKTIIVVVSEHGEMFAKHGRFGRAGAIRGTLYEDVVHVPLLIRLPGVPGRRLRGLVQLVDIMPTLLEMLDLQAPRKVQGASLLPLIAGGKPVNEVVYAGTTYNSYMPETYGPYGVSSINEFIRGDKWKLIHEITFSDDNKKSGRKDETETFELYDLQSDPGETVNLVAEQPAIVTDLRLKLKRWGEGSRRFVKGTPSVRDIPDEVMEDAKERGYW